MTGAGNAIGLSNTAAVELRGWVEAERYEVAARLAVEQHILPLLRRSGVSALPSIAIGGMSRVGKSMLAERMKLIGYSIVPTDAFRRFYWSKDEGHTFVTDLQSCRAAFYTACFQAAQHDLCVEGDDVWRYVSARWHGEIRKAKCDYVADRWDSGIEAPLILLGITNDSVKSKAKQIWQSATAENDTENASWDTALRRAEVIAHESRKMEILARMIGNVHYVDAYTQESMDECMEAIFKQVTEVALGNSDLTLTGC